jgi:hypothetical protein
VAVGWRVTVWQRQMSGGRFDMALEYTNRHGDTYYLQAGTTKTGKPKYYFGRKLNGTPLDALPEGYEIYESPEVGQVYARKQRASRISALERELVAQALRREAGLEHFIVDVEDDSLVVYLPGMDLRDADDRLGGIFGLPGSLFAGAKERMIACSHYSKMMRFTLADEEERTFRVERWCFLGSIDNWHFLASAAPLDKQLRKYATHLGKESFYDLM